MITKTYNTSKDIEIGQWYKFEANCPFGKKMVGYGKVVAFIGEDEVLVEKYFELPYDRPYAARKWYDYLQYAD